MRDFLHLTFIAASTLVVAGCAATPVFDVESADVQVNEVQDSPQAHKGKTVVWGGSVVAVRNHSEHTLIEVVARPLDKSQRPIVNDRTFGRFLIKSGRFIEPEVYQTGRLVTVTGEISFNLEKTIDDRKYQFPVVEEVSFKLWPKRVVRPAPWPYYDPWFWSFRYHYGHRGYRFGYHHYY